MADARKDRRTLLSLKIRYKSATLEDFIERYSMDISRGGVFIKAKKPLAVGTLLKFEFVLQDQSILIHGVGRVAWRREEHEADASNPAGMGIKFIKMDPESRSTVDRIVEKRGLPGVFDQGKEGLSAGPSSIPSEPQAADATKVRHVSEFLASAMEEGGAGDAAIQAARAGAQRARAASERAGTARGAFSAPGETAGSRQRRGLSDAPARGAMSAFGGAAMSSGAGFRSSAAPAMDDFDDDDDFLDNETTKVQELPSASEFPDAAATVVASETPFAMDPRVTPVVPASTAPRSSLAQEVPDLFGPDSFGPAAGELIDASLLDPAVVTVPPKASALPRGAVPDARGIHADAFKVPQAPAPVGTQQRPTKQKKSRVGLLLFLVFVLLLVAGGSAAWQLGLTDDLMKLAAPYLGQSAEPATKTAPASRQAPVPVAAEPATRAEQATVEEEAPADEGEVDASRADSEVKAAPEADPGAASTKDTTGLVKMKVVTVPNGAFVSVNGKGAGRAPLTLEYRAGTELTLFSKARGFLAHREQVVIDASQTEIKMVLSPLPWVVEVVTEPPGASASSVGGGQVTTPGDLSFRSMTSSRDIVISKDGYKTVTKNISRGLFVEERARMAASVRVTLAKDGTAAPAAETAPVAEPVVASKASIAAPEPPTAPEPAPDDSAPVTEAPSADDAP